MYIDLIVTDKKEWAISSKYLQTCLPGAKSIDMSGNLSIKPFFNVIKSNSRWAPIRYLLINDHARLDSDVKNIAPDHQFGDAWLYLHDFKRYIKGTRFAKKGRLYLLGCEVSRYGTGEKACLSIANAIQVPVVSATDVTYGGSYKGKPTLYTPGFWMEFFPDGKQWFHPLVKDIYPRIKKKITRCEEIRFRPFS
jgi:hypothetical protein